MRCRGADRRFPVGHALERAPLTVTTLPHTGSQSKGCLQQIGLLVRGGTMFPLPGRLKPGSRAWSKRQ